MKQLFSSGTVPAATVAAFALAVAGATSAQQVPEEPVAINTHVSQPAAYTPLSFDETSMDRLGNAFFEDHVMDTAAGRPDTGAPGLRPTLEEEPAEPAPAQKELRSRTDGKDFGAE